MYKVQSILESIYLYLYYIIIIIILHNSLAQQIKDKVDVHLCIISPTLVQGKRVKYKNLNLFVVSKIIILQFVTVAN